MSLFDVVSLRILRLPSSSPASHVGAAAVILAAVGVIPGLACADLPSIRFDRIHPLGCSAGASVEVEIAGAEIEELKTLFFDQPGFTVELVKDRVFKIAVAADVPAGTYDVRLVGRFGVSNPRLFAVSRGFADVLEKEPNNEAAQSQPVAVNSVIYGMSDGNGEDDFRFPATKGQRITLTCQAQKLHSAMDATMAITTAAGNPIASNSDYYGSDPFLDFVAPADGDYVVSISDLSFRGGFPYRLIVSDKPQIENVFPRVIEAGKKAELTFYGRNFGPTGRASTLKVSDLPLEEIRAEVAAPADILTTGIYRFLDHPTDHSVLPTAATASLFGFQALPAALPEATGAQTILVSESPVTLEVEPNDEAAKPQAIVVPAVVSARLDQPRDADWYEFEPAASGSYGIEVYCERIAGQADPYVVVMDDKGNRVAELDDFGARINAYDAHLRDPSGTVNLQEKRKYRLLVQDRYQRGGPRFQYVLSIRKAAPEFSPAVIHHQNPGPGGTTVFRGGAQYLDVIVNQRDGFNDPITITAEKLPPGMHAAPTTIGNNSRGVFVLWADENAEPWTGPIELVATATQGDRELRRVVRPYSRVWNDAGANSSSPSRVLAVAIRETAPYSLQFAESEATVKSGEKLELALKLKRLWPEFKEKVAIQALGFPGGINLPNSDIAAGALEAKVTLTTQAGMKPGRYTLAVLGQGQVPFNKDPKAATKPNTLVAIPSQPVTVTVVAPEKK